MYNCFFEDCSFYFNVKADTFICKDRDGYFIKVQVVSKMAIIELMKLGVVPSYDEEKDIFFIKIYLSNASKIRINGFPLSLISEKYPVNSTAKSISIKEAALKRYAADHPKSVHVNGRACYAKRLLLKIRS